LADSASDRFEPERRRLAGMLPGAEIAHRRTHPDGTVEIVALVDDLDGPIPVLVERGRYRHCAELDRPGLRTLVAPGFRLVLGPLRSTA
jgi:hypothetical protein